MKRWSILCTVLAIAVGGIGGAMSASAATYTVDAVHSSVVFRIKHNEVAWFYGRINAPTGTIEYDAAKPEASVFSFTLKTANLDTGNAQRDNHIKSAEYFNAADFPDITFKSTAVKKGEGNILQVTGDLMFHGVKKSITVPVEMTGTKATPRPLIGFEGTFTIKRSEYGITAGAPGLGDEVRLTVSFEGRV